MQDELINSYMTVLNEGKTEAPSHEVEGNIKSGKPLFGDFKEGNESDENVDLETPEESEHCSDDDTGTAESTKKLDKSSFNNPFDVLYSKILGENSFNFNTEKDNELEPSLDSGSDFGSEFGDSDLSDLDDMGEDDLDDDMGEDESDDELSGEVDLKEVLGKLKDVLSELEKIVSDDDEEEDDIEDLEDLEDSEEEDSEEEEESDEDEDLVKEESWKEAEARKEGRENRKKKLASKKDKASKLKKASKYDDREEVSEESVKVKGLKKGVNLKPFSGNIKKLQNKKAEVSENNPKASKGKAQTPSTGSGFDGVLKKLSPTAGHNLTKASSHTVSGAVKAGKGLFDQ